ncbi:MAG TPA: hypothetical protein VEX11_10695, partial [Acetobacteraceae bacterium]|nr:hypothetical protein [Acetobacteraceae bacterium]
MAEDETEVLDGTRVLLKQLRGGESPEEVRMHADADVAPDRAGNGLREAARPARPVGMVPVGEEPIGPGRCQVRPVVADIFLDQASGRGIDRPSEGLAVLHAASFRILAIDDEMGETAAAAIEPNDLLPDAEMRQVLRPH